MKQFIHPSKEEITLTGVIGALADPVRLRIFISMVERQSAVSCTQLSPCENMAKSTLSHHFRILREAGLIRTTKQGVENRNCVRQDDIEERFPGLVEKIISLAQKELARI